MDTDLATYIGTVERTVSTSEREGEAVNVLRAARTYDSTIDDVWDACTNAERIARWFLPVKGDLRVGGRFQLEGNAGGEVLACDPPNRFAITWEHSGEVSWVDVTLAASPDGTSTTLTLEHTGPLGANGWNEYGPGGIGVGWDLTLVGLGAHLTTGEPNDAAKFATWTASAGGRAFVTTSSQAWCDANIAGGADDARAHAAAAKTTAAYTEG